MFDGDDPEAPLLFERQVFGRNDRFVVAQAASDFEAIIGAKITQADGVFRAEGDVAILVY